MIPYVLVVEDDRDVQQYIKDLLVENSFTVKTASDGVSAINLLKKSEPDLVILDLKLPDVSGEGVLAEVRKLHPTTPTIILTSKDGVSDKVKGLALGADDYITKPFIADEFIARVKARLRNHTNEIQVLKVGDLELDNKQIQVTRGGKAIHLTPQEFKLLEYLMANQGTVLTRDMILNRIWLYSPDVESRVVDVYMGYLRKKVDARFKKKLLHSVRGFGYTIKDS